MWTLSKPKKPKCFFSVSLFGVLCIWFYHLWCVHHRLMWMASDKRNMKSKIVDDVSWDLLCWAACMFHNLNFLFLWACEKKSPPFSHSQNSQWRYPRAHRTWFTVGIFVISRMRLLLLFFCWLLLFDWSSHSQLELLCIFAFELN